MIDPKYQAPSCQNTASNRQITTPQHDHYDPPQPRFEKKPTRNFTLLIESLTNLFDQLSVVGIIHPVGTKPVDTSSQFYRANLMCVYHSNCVGHDTKYCIHIKHKIHDLIKKSMVKNVAPNVYINPHSNYRGTNINMIEIEDELSIVKAIVPAGADNHKKVVAFTSMNVKLNLTCKKHHQAFAFVSRECKQTNGITHVLPKSLPKLRQSLLVEKYTNDDGLREGIGNLLGKGDVVTKKITETPGVRDAESMEKILNLIFTPLFISQLHWIEKI